MFKLIDKKIFTFLCSNFVFIWTYDIELSLFDSFFWNWSPKSACDKNHKQDYVNCVSVFTLMITYHDVHSYGLMMDKLFSEFNKLKLSQKSVTNLKVLKDDQ